MRVNKRQIVVEAATRLFSMHGFQAIGVDRIISDSGVARMTLYRHFASKDDLIREVLLQRNALIFDSVQAHMRKHDDPVQKVKAIFDWYGSWFKTPEFAGCLFERALAEFGRDHPKVSDMAIGYRWDMTEMMAVTLAETVRAAEAKRLSGIFMLLLDGATVEARASNDARWAAEAWHVADMLLRQARQIDPEAAVRA